MAAGADRTRIFIDTSEAVFIILDEHKDLEPLADLQRKLLQRRVQTAMDDPRPGIPAKKVMKHLRAKLEEPQPESANWKRRSLS